MKQLGRYRATRVGKWDVTFDETVCDNGIAQLLEAFLVSGVVPENWVKLKSSDNANVWKFPVADRWCVFKEYLMRDPFDGVKAFVGRSRAKRAWINGKMLTQEGTYTPQMLAFGGKRSFPLTYQSFLVTEFISNSLGIYTLLKENLPLSLTKEQIKLKRTMIRSFGSFIGRLHAKGFAHGDLRLDNILIAGWGTDEYRFFLIDNERNRYFQKGIPHRYRMKNLVQLNMLVLPQVTFTDRIRFFRAYLFENPKLKPVEKEWMRNVFLKTRERLQKKIPGIWKH